MSAEESFEDTPGVTQAMIVAGRGGDLALQNAIHLWAAATTDAESACCEDLLRSKRQAVSSFFVHAGKHPGEVTALDVKSWRDALEGKGFKPATVYARISRLSSFYTWVMRDPALGQFITSNPAHNARPKCPKPYQTESSKALDDEQISALMRVVIQKAAAGDIVGKRDYALLLMFITTGMRRQEVIGLRGSDLELRKDDLIVRCRVKGGDYVDATRQGRTSRRAALVALLLKKLEGVCARCGNREDSYPSDAPHVRADNLRRDRQHR
jgi:integrase